MNDCNHIDNIHCNDPIDHDNGKNDKYLAIFRFFAAESEFVMIVIYFYVQVEID